MKHISTFLLFLLTFGTAVAQCPAKATISDDFEIYTAGTGAPLADCWTHLGTAGMTVGVRNSAGEALSGDNYLSCYIGFTPPAEVYFISPELSTIDGAHGSIFHIKSSGTGEFEYGTMSDPGDMNTYIPAASATDLTQTYKEVNTGAIAANSGHVHFVIKATGTSAHAVIRVDDFSWAAANGTGIWSVENEIEASVYPNPVTDNLTIEFENSAERNIRIMDVAGKLVLSEAIFDARTQLGTDALEPGIYVVNVLEGDKTFTQKILKVN